MTEPLVVLEANLQVKLELPVLTQGLDARHLTFTSGDESVRELAFETIESKKAENWIIGLDSGSPDRLEIESLAVEDFLEPDPSLVRRRYVFRMINHQGEVGQYAENATLRVRSGLPTAPALPPLIVTVLDSVVILPNPLIISIDPSGPSVSRQVCVVDRTGNRATAVPVRYDKSRLRVDSIGTERGTASKFNVVPVSNAVSATETAVQFQVGEAEVRELIVRFEGTHSP